MPNLEKLFVDFEIGKISHIIKLVKKDWVELINYKLTTTEILVSSHIIEYNLVK